MSNEKPAAPPAEPRDEGKTLFGIRPIKILFAAEYVLQGLANPFQGITYQPFFSHFRFHYGMEEAAVQGLFARSYLAWSFKPILGFIIDAIGKTRSSLILLLGGATIFFLLAPFIDLSANVFFWTMFILSVVMACTDVVVDRATVVDGDEESQSSGKSKAATVGLNQAICWIAIYGTSILSAFFGGYIAESAKINYLLWGLAAAPFLVLLVALRLPKDKAHSIPLTSSVTNFWNGLNTGPILWVVVFYFLFHFQPQAGALWNNYLIEELKFEQSQIGMADSASYVGYFFGTLAFARWGIRWQDAYGLKRLFMFFIPLSALVSLTQYLMVDPLFSQITDGLHTLPGLNGLDREEVRLGFLASYQAVLYFVNGFIRMCTFSLVGVVIPATAAGSLFAGFMSVANIAYSFSYSTGSWLYTHGLNYGVLRDVQSTVFGVPGKAGDDLHISMLVLIGSLAYLLSFAAVQKLPDRRATLSTEDVTTTMIGPEHFKELGAERLSTINIGTGVAMVAAFLLLFLVMGQDPIASVLLSFFGVAFLRKAYLDSAYDALKRR